MHPLAPGDPETIGSYRVIARLGAGGMGVVFLARSRGGRAVAVKVIRPDLADQPGFRARFAREIGAARRVGGAFTCAVLDADADAPRPWLATEFVAGPSLDEAVKAHGPLPAAALDRLAAGLAEALASIHAAGVVHRDLKPSNILLAGDGPRVIDFGISRSADDSVLTATGALVGSAGYMAPETVTGTESGPASDVFSLGAVLTFAATGRGPFGTGPTPVLLHRIVHDPPDLTAVPTGALRELISACLDKDARRRPLPRTMAPAPVPKAIPGLVAWSAGPLNGDIRERETQMRTLLRQHRPSLGRRRFLIAALAGGASVAVTGGAAVAWATREGADEERVEHRWTVRAKNEDADPQIRLGNTFLYREDDTLQALDAASGKRLWQASAGLFARSTPLVAASPSSVLLNEFGLQELDLKTGDQKRLIDEPPPLAEYEPRDILGVRDGVAFLQMHSVPKGTDAIGARTLTGGKERWTLPVEWGPGTRFLLSGDRLYFVDGEHRLLAINVTDGSIVWKQTVDDRFGPLLASSGMVYVPYDSGIRAFDAATGRQRWNHNVQGGISAVSLSQGALYAFAPGGTAFSIDAKTGRPRWTSTTRLSGEPSTSAVCGGILFTGVEPLTPKKTGDSSAGLFGWDTATGKVVWRFPREPSEGGLGWKLITGGDMVFAAQQADLLAFEPL
ncbi:PQQ-binding-like beta-propeller repeat protein [Actinomadura sp. B10D3]|uniref:serine/threonine-protein kinase n=1 Tax=Actinomadura sp. B10D3 TaxID=3153557 RepID=UPI00325D4B83